MQYAHGLELNLKTVNQILKIAQQKNYVKSHELKFDCHDFRFDEENHKFEFHVLHPKHNIILDMDKFIECYTIYIKK